MRVAPVIVGSLLVGGALAVLSVSGCGVKAQGQGAKTPEEIIAEQERLAYEQELARREREENDLSPDEGEPLESEERDQFNQEKAKIQLMQAARGAATCPNSVGESAKDEPRGEGKITIVFSNDGSVKEATIDPPFTDTSIGKCATRAMKAVLVPPFRGQSETITWTVDLSGAAGAEEPKKDDTKKKK